jgi:tRNA A-37 threonylcarbamoyl transferase component Bud32
MTEAKNRPSSSGLPGTPASPASRSRTITGPRLATASDATVPGSAPGVTPVPDGATRLRVVTISPGTQSFPDIEAPSRDRRDPYVGNVIDGRYRVETLLGEGGMGVVYRCSHTIIGKKLALKVLRADLARDQEVTERFLNEAKAASGIGNPHIVDISDFGQFPDGATYFVMEYLNGIPLGSAIQNGQPLPPKRLLTIARQIAEGLAAAHAAGIVHRDLKPDNIFLVERGADKDFVKILDFGIAKVSSTEGKLTRAGAVFGTPHYMSPEQAAGTPVDQRGDIYSLGVILYELAAAKVPFDADNFMGVLSQHMYKAPTPLREATPRPEDVSPALEAVVMKCLAKRPENRYQSMAEVIVDVDRLLAGTKPQAAGEHGGAYATPAAYYDAGPTPSGTPKKSRSVVIGMIAVLALFAVAGAVLKLRPQEKTAAPEATPPPAERAAQAVNVVPPQATPIVALKRVTVATEPMDAHILLDGKDLGEQPVIVEVPEGKTVELQIQREGYQKTRIVLDGSEEKQAIKLEKVAAPVRATKTGKPPPTAAPKPSATKKRPSLGSGEIIDPWSK